MRKLLPVLLIVLLVWGCNKEKIYKENLNGTWDVYKYLFNNTDKTSKFLSDNPGYSISFTNDGKITEQNVPSAGDTMLVYGTYSFTDNDQKILLVNVFYSTTYHYDSTNTVIIDSTINTTTKKREYTIFNLTKDHVQLRNDSSQLYMRKLPQ
jgi:hypothetical protein